MTNGLKRRAKNFFYYVQTEHENKNWHKIILHNAKEKKMRTEKKILHILTFKKKLSRQTSFCCIEMKVTRTQLVKDGN